MKKLTLFLLAALMITSVFTGCSASAYMDDPYAGGYSNVSTTRNGVVNGTNGRYAGSGYDANGAYTGTYNGGAYNGAYGGYPSTGATRSTTTTGRANANSGTGMAGGR